MPNLHEMATSSTLSPSSRRHDLDALRAAAMLLGIVFHVSLSFALGAGWSVQDVSQSKAAYLFQAFVHGFRMQLFMVVSGFFTAMLWRQKGLKALLWHRCRRVLLPCLLGLITVVPAMIGAIVFASQYTTNRNQKAALAEPASANLWAAIRKGDAAALDAHLKNTTALTNQHLRFGVTPLTWAALIGQRDLAAVLLDRGARVGDRNRDGSTALHAAAFMGHTELAELLIRRGADVNAPNSSGEIPLQTAAQPFSIVAAVAAQLSIAVDEQKIKQGRERIVAQLRSAGAKDATAPLGKEAARPSALAAVYKGLTEIPVFILIWFLWFLVWLVGAFAVCVWVADKLGWRSAPRWLTLSPARLLWLVPLTLIPMWFMAFGHGEFGPDTVMGIIPTPHVLLYYAVFFFFGAAYCDCNDVTGQIGRAWRWILPASLFVVFPVGLEFATGTFGLRDALLPAKFHRPVTMVSQALYAWLMAFGCMGLFRSLLTRENRTIRYLSDSSYWLYLAHLPPCIVAQALISQWPLPVWVKLPLLSVVLTGFLLLTYHKLVRYTWIGRMLNGPRTRPAKPGVRPAPEQGSIGASGVPTTFESTNPE